MRGTFLSKIFVGLLVLAAAMTARPARAQTDIVGEWGNRFHEDLWERRSGLQVGDFTGFAMTEAGRRMAESWHPSWFSLHENECRPHTSIYGLRGPADLRITKEVDPITQRVIAYNVAFSIGQMQKIWVDGRPHPPEYAPHTWAGFSTGEWEGNRLKVTTTHVKAAYLQRNGAPHSDEAVTTEYWIRHDNTLLLMSIIDDPIYYEEPVVKTTNWEAQDVTLGGSYCGPAQVADETPGQRVQKVPHFLPGKNDQIQEFTSQRGVPLEAALGYRDTIYPEYQQKLKQLQQAAVAPSARAASARPAGTETGVFGHWTLSIAKSSFKNNLTTNFSLSGSDASAPQWRTMTFEPSGDGFKHTTDTQIVANDTSFYRVEYTAKFDGKDYPVQGSAGLDTVALRKIDDRTYERVGKDRAEIVETTTYKLAPDGKAMTVIVNGTSQGVEYHNQQVFERTDK